jgi:hypothetical protein
MPVMFFHPCQHLGTALKLSLLIKTKPKDTTWQEVASGKVQWALQ